MNHFILMCLGSGWGDYSANKPDGTSIRNGDYTLYLLPHKKTIPFSFRGERNE